ncbi:2-C-methyl-D-erythritol 4-phosphate cytidylyltransferase [Mycobacterium sp. SMC-4]|uniref:IspD/TarI family cytidylyltransferase n=1 Tax=Mycobacterium sp. SMC-4 TaxID=2857059 RepID=UPI0021B4B4B3|nr:2-C-methyl-D-erythritol 4-phosphate cytidylyltransferase [Mycobacterium sp. SMC-4]UXA16535.1 2-C-methyl-D-erythritol 4-phosphate cytidylyltransferase [Mycobacterium sp. SMC-4]
MNTTAIVPVPAAYVGRRETLLAPVAGAAVLSRIVETLRQSVRVVVAVAPSLTDSLIEAIGVPDFSDVHVVTAEGVGQRAQCLQAGLTNCGDGPVLVHDLGWPVFTAATLQRVVAAVAAGAQVVVPTRAVTDSIKRVDAQGSVRQTLDRSRLRTVQYPRGFDPATLRTLLDAAQEPFDELSAALRAGIAVVQVDGDDRAQRVEIPRDAAYLTAVIEAPSVDR